MIKLEDYPAPEGRPIRPEGECPDQMKDYDGYRAWKDALYKFEDWVKKHRRHVIAERIVNSPPEDRCLLILMLDYLERTAPSDYLTEMLRRL